MSNFWGSYHWHRGRGPLDASSARTQQTMGGAGVSGANGVPPKAASSSALVSAQKKGGWSHLFYIKVQMLD